MKEKNENGNSEISSENLTQNGAPSSDPDETDETLANALRKLISHRFKQKIDESRSDRNRPGLSYLCFKRRF